MDSGDAESGDGPLPGVATPTTDGRLLRGARTRAVVLRKAVDIASLEDLDGLSFGRVAAEAGVSKAGVQTLFGNKEGLQLATVDHARDLFVEAVVAPARSAPGGAARLRLLVDLWIAYAATPLFAGGCFQVANLAGFDGRPGRVRDALFGNQGRWRERLAGELRHAVDAREIAELDAELAAFQLDSVLCAANVALQSGERDVVDKVHRTVDSLLRPA